MSGMDHTSNPDQQFLPKLTRPDLKQVAEKMKADQTREIAKFKRELRQS
jgi:hypothetical protein